MGTRYDFELAVNIREDAPESVIDVLSFLLLPGNTPPAEAPDHPFFGSDWKKYPFVNWATVDPTNAGDTACSLRRVLRYRQHGVDHYQYTVQLRFTTRAEGLYENALSFAMWLAQWSDQNEFVGYYKAESRRHPTLLYFHDRELYLREVVESPQRVTDGAHWE